MRIPLLFFASVLLLTPAVLNGDQIISGTMTFASLDSFPLGGQGQTDVFTADTHITGFIVLDSVSPYMRPFGASQPFTGTVSIDPSGNVCGGGLSLTGHINGGGSFDCGNPYDVLIDGNVAMQPFLYTSGSVVESLPFNMTLDIRPTGVYMGPSYNYLFTGSGTATVAGHSVVNPNSQTVFNLDSYTLTFTNTPEPSTGALVILALAAIALAKLRTAA